MKTDIEIVQTRMAQAFQAESSIPVTACEGWVSGLSADGTWPDLDYAEDNRGEWSPQDHWRRIRDLSLYLQSGRIPDQRVAATRDAVCRAIGYWVASPSVAPNWWYNCIGIPLEMGPTLILTGDWLEDGLRDAVIALMNHPPGESNLEVADGAYAQHATGQNLVWLAWIQLMMGAAADNPEWMMNASREVSSVVVITTDEGIQPDFSFQQHGPQYYSGGYGLSFARSVGGVLMAVHGTAFNLSAEAEAVFAQYLLDGQRWIVRGDSLIFHSLGREISRPHSPLLFLAELAEDLAAAGAPRAAELRELGAGIREGRPVGDLDGIRVFYRSDVAIQQTSAFSISVRGTSFRLRGGESGNGENLLGEFLAHGAHAILRRGDEYRNVFPLWDWRKIPGGLIPVDAELSLFDWGDGKPVRAGYVGGVSSGPSACFGYDYDFEGTRAKRGWFLTDGGLIQMVANVSDRDHRSLVQTLNQCRGRGPVRTLSEDGIVTNSDGFEFRGALSAVEHDGVGYVFPEPREVLLESTDRVGTWETINASGPTGPVEDRVFSLSFQLTDADRTGFHAFILPGSLSPLESRQEVINRWTVIRNDNDCQAVYDTAQHELLVLFYAKGRIVLENGFSLMALQPCSLIIEFADPGLIVHAADPTKSLDRLALVVSGDFEVADAPGVQSGFHGLDLELPSGSLRGRAIEPVRLNGLSD